MKNEALLIRTNKTTGSKFYEPNIYVSSQRKYADDMMTRQDVQARDVSLLSSNLQLSALWSLR